MFDGARNLEDHRSPPLHPDRLAAGGAIVDTLNNALDRPLRWWALGALRVAFAMLCGFLLTAYLWLVLA